MLWSKKARGDALIVAAVLCIAVTLFIVFFFSDAKNGSDAVILRREGVEERVSLLEEKRFSICSNGITLVLEVSDGSLSVVSSDCPDQTCMHMNAIGRKGGGVIICLPALVEIRTEGGKTSDETPHALAY